MYDGDRCQEQPPQLSARRAWAAETNNVTLHQIVVHVAIDTGRHAGHADTIWELIDRAADLTPGNANTPSEDEAWWNGYRDRVERAAREAAASRLASG